MSFFRGFSRVISDNAAKPIWIYELLYGDIRPQGRDTTLGPGWIGDTDTGRRCGGGVGVYTVKFDVVEF